MTNFFANLSVALCVANVMTSYLAHHTKKKQILARREAALKRLIAAGAQAGKLVAAAEAVRDARVRVLRVQRSIIVPAGDAADLYSKIDEQIANTANTHASTILVEFGCVTNLDASGSK